MAEEQSSLRQAIDRIMGYEAGGGGGQGGQQQATVKLPAPAPFSSMADIGRTVGTTSALSNVVAPAAPDPFEAQNTALSASLAPPAAASAAAPSLLSYDQYVAQQSAANQGRAMPPSATAIGYTQYSLAQPRSSPLTKDEYAKTMTDQYARAGWNRQGTTPPDQRLIDTGYQSYLQGAYKPL